jgi:hypothetical protein
VDAVGEADGEEGQCEVGGAEEGFFLERGLAVSADWPLVHSP